MAFFKTFWDLKAAQAYTTHTIGTYDTNTTSGGGTFRWIAGNNTSLTDIPGFRIKPTASTVGYWERIFEDSANVGWFGTINTSSQGLLSAYGFTQSQLDSTYGLANLILTTDTYDTAAIKYAFYLMQEVRGFQSLKFESKDYYLTSTCYFPGLFTPASTDPINYIIEGSGALIRDHSTLVTAIDYFGSRLPSNSTQAEAWQRRSFVIKNFLMHGQGDLGISSGTACINLGESYNAEITHNTIQYANIGIKARFCMNGFIAFNNIVNYRGDGIYVVYGSDWGGTTSSGASNHTTVFKNRLRGYPSSGKGIHVRGASGSVVDGNIWEGDAVSAGTHAVYFDNAGATTVKECTIRNTHIERPHNVNGAFFYIRGTTGMYTIEKPYVQYAGTLIEVVDQSGYPEVKLSGIGYVPNACKLKSGASSRWIIEHNILPNVYGITTDATMRTGFNAGDNSTIWYSGYRSTTAVTIGTGTKGFDIPLNATGYTAGNTIRIESAANSGRFMTGTVTSYTAGSGALITNITAIGGSGTYTDWVIWTNDSTPSVDRIIYFGTNSQGG